MFCSKCGSQIADGSQFCSKCESPTLVENNKVEEKVVPPAVPVPEPPAQAVPNDPAPASDQKSSFRQFANKKNLIIAGIILGALIIAPVVYGMAMKAYGDYRMKQTDDMINSWIDPDGSEDGTGKSGNLTAGKRYKTNDPVAANQMRSMAHADGGKLLKAIGFTKAEEGECRYEGQNVPCWEAIVQPYSDFAGWDQFSLLVKNDEVAYISAQLLYVKGDATAENMYNDLRGVMGQFSGYAIDRDKIQEALNQAEAKRGSSDFPSSEMIDFKINGKPCSVRVIIDLPVGTYPERYTVYYIQTNYL
jgi:hypothetical protein